MPIRVFPPHYQLVYINFDISSFSLISYIAILWNMLNYFYFLIKVCLSDLKEGKIVYSQIEKQGKEKYITLIDWFYRNIK